VVRLCDWLSEAPIQRLAAQVSLHFWGGFLTGCANSCFFGFWNPPSGTIGTVISNPPPTCKLAAPKGAVRVAVQVSGSCASCSGSNRVHAVVLNLGGIDVHSSANAAGQSSGWQPLLPEPGKDPTQVELLSEKTNAFSTDSTEELAIPAGSYDLVRLRLTRDQTRVDDKPLLGNACGKAEPNCVIMADGQIAHLVFEADTLEFLLTSEATVGGLPIILPDSNNELFIELTPVLSMARPFGEATRSFIIFPGRARIEPRPGGKAPTIPGGI
jgi:hypothetical protein